MRNKRSALWALGLAGAAYMWKNRGRLKEQMGNMRQGAPSQLPDYRNNQPNDRTNSGSSVDDRNRSVGGGNNPFGGTQV